MEMVFDERHVARFLDLCPSTPLEWPVALLRRLLALRKRDGHERFMREVHWLLAR